MHTASVNTTEDERITAEMTSFVDNTSHLYCTSEVQSAVGEGSDRNIRNDGGKVSHFLTERSSSVVSADNTSAYHSLGEGGSFDDPISHPPHSLYHTTSPVVIAVSV